MTTISLRIFPWILAALGATAIPTVASAHDIWLTLTGDAASRRVLINYGHPNDRPPVAVEKILDLFAINSNRKTSLLSNTVPTQEGGNPVATSRPFEDNGHLVIAARYDNGFWTRAADGSYRNATRRLVPDAVDSLWSAKFAKAVTGPGSPWQMILGHDLEIVPLSDPGVMKPGQVFRLRVLFHGEPLTAAEVERGDGITPMAEKDIPRFTTDRNGVASIPIEKTGPCLLVVDHKVMPSATPDQANYDLFTATLWFTIASSAN